jgi:hypothetical protein
MRRCCSGACSTQWQWHSDSDPLVSTACDDAAAVPTARSGTPTVLHWCQQHATVLQRCQQHATMLQRCLQHAVALRQCSTGVSSMRQCCSGASSMRQCCNGAHTRRQRTVALRSGPRLHQRCNAACIARQTAPDDGSWTMLLVQHDRPPLTTELQRCLQHAVALRQCSTGASSMRRGFDVAYSTQWHSDDASRRACKLRRC